jgi:hypothetical protein
MVKLRHRGDTMERAAAVCEADEYFKRLVERANDGIDSLHKSVLWFTGLGVLLVALAISTNDAAVLVAQNTTLPELKLSVPVTLTLAVGPFAFFAAYLFVAWQLHEAEATVEAVDAEFEYQGLAAKDRARFAQLLVGTPFVRGSAFDTRPSRWDHLLAVGLRLVFPLIVLLVLEISSIRVQNETLTLAQQLTIVFLTAIAVSKPWRTTVKSWAFGARAMAAVAGAVLLVLLFLWTSVPTPNSWALSASRAYDEGRDRPLCEAPGWRRCTAWALADPLDMVVCRLTDWGCRYMRLYYVRFKAMDVTKSVASISGIDLHERHLRFADMDGADFGEADLSAADLRGALLRHANLSSADLNDAHLDGAHFSGAELGCVNLDRESDLKKQLCAQAVATMQPSSAWAEPGKH